MAIKKHICWKGNFWKDPLPGFIHPLLFDGPDPQALQMPQYLWEFPAYCAQEFSDPAPPLTFGLTIS